jgi:hypothetical protein
MNGYKEERDTSYVIHPKAILAGCTPNNVGEIS